MSACCTASVDDAMASLLARGGLTVARVLLLHAAAELH